MNNKVIVIAEAGINHNGSLITAKELIDVAAKAGADYIKFQTFIAEKIATRFATKADYQIINGGSSENQVSFFKKLELTFEDHIHLLEHCQAKGIKFLSTPFDLDSIFLLKKVGLNLGKIPSGEITNLPYLKSMANNFSELFLSTGMSDIEEVDAAIKVIESTGFSRKKITILHCNTEYPTPYSDVNLRAMVTLRNNFGVNVGYSDHTLGIEIPIAAVALGATVIEKHFTLNRDMPGPDHKASLEPEELLSMIKGIRHIEEALGVSEKKVSPSEEKNKVIARKSIVAATYIYAGEIFTEKNLTIKRPGSGISPMKWDEVIGKIANRDYAADEMIEL